MAAQYSIIVRRKPFRRAVAVIRSPAARRRATDYAAPPGITSGPLASGSDQPGTRPRAYPAAHCCAPRRTNSARTTFSNRTKPRRRVRARSAASRSTTTLNAAVQDEERNGCCAVCNTAGHTHSSNARICWTCRRALHTAFSAVCCLESTGFRYLVGGVSPWPPTVQAVVVEGYCRPGALGMAVSAEHGGQLVVGRASCCNVWAADSVCSLTRSCWRLPTSRACWVAMTAASSRPRLVSGGGGSSRPISVTTGAACVVSAGPDGSGPLAYGGCEGASRRTNHPSRVERRRGLRDLTGDERSMTGMGRRGRVHTWSGEPWRELNVQGRALGWPSREARGASRRPFGFRASAGRPCCVGFWRCAPRVDWTGQVRDGRLRRGARR